VKFRIWIAPHGDDANPGTHDRPIQTLGGALDRLPKASFRAPDSFSCSKDTYEFILDERETPRIQTPQEYILHYKITDATNQNLRINGIVSFKGGRTNEFGDFKITGIDPKLGIIRNSSLDLTPHNCFTSCFTSKDKPCATARNACATKIYIVDGKARGQYRMCFINGRNDVTVNASFDPWPTIGDTFRVCRDSVVLVYESESLP
jgi:hypothetical protein